LFFYKSEREEREEISRDLKKIPYIHLYFHRKSSNKGENMRDSTLQILEYCMRAIDTFKSTRVLREVDLEKLKYAKADAQLLVSIFALQHPESDETGHSKSKS
jgi:hypothetical protein